MKRCCTCKRRRGAKHFTKNAVESDGLERYCRDCKNDRQRFTRYKITREDYDRLVAEQGGRCGVCGCECSERDVLSVDHCHESNRIRGLLCSACNRAVGLLGDRVETVAAALAYLNKSMVVGLVCDD